MAGVRVDRDFARFGQKSYAINKINSVEIRAVHPNKPDGAIIAGLIALVLILVGLGQLSSADIGDGAICLIIGFLFGGLAGLMWTHSQVLEFQLFLMTSSSEAQAFASRDEDEVLTLRDRIEAAMAGRL